MNRKANHSYSNKFFRAFARPVLTLLAFGVVTSGPALADNAGDMPWGYETAAGRCVVCHSLEQNGPFRVAPNLWGIVGAEKARDRSWYAYSPALIQIGGTWTVEDLDAYLADASGFAPGSTKSIRVGDEQERQEIIDFLAQLKD